MPAGFLNAERALSEVVRRGCSQDNMSNALVELMHCASYRHDHVGFARWRERCEERVSDMPPNILADFYLKQGIGQARFGRFRRAEALMKEALEIAGAAGLHEAEFRIERIVAGLKDCEQAMARSRTRRPSRWSRPPSCAVAESLARSAAERDLVAGVAVADVAAVAGTGGVGTSDGGKGERHDEQGEQGANTTGRDLPRAGCEFSATEQTQPGCGASDFRAILRSYRAILRHLGILGDSCSCSLQSPTSKSTSSAALPGRASAWPPPRPGMRCSRPSGVGRWSWRWWTCSYFGRRPVAGNRAPAVLFPSLPLILYTTLTPRTAGVLLALGQRGIQHAVFVNYDDHPSRLREVLSQEEARSSSRQLLDQLGDALAPLPSELRWVLEEALRSPGEVQTVGQVAARARVDRRTCERWFTRVGLPSPRHVLSAARVVYAHRLLQDPGFTIEDVAKRLGYAQTKTLQLHASTYLGLTAGDAAVARFRRSAGACGAAFSDPPQAAVLVS
jgi:AraC-like DNA-binding protein